MLFNIDLPGELEQAPAFSLTADTTPDVSNKDQLSIVVRYVADNVPVECLLSFGA